MNLNIRSATAGYNNKILVSDRKFSPGKNDEFNTLELAKDQKISHKVVVQPTITHKKFSRETNCHP